MNRKVSIPCLMVLFSVLVLMQGCKIEITVPEGGNVVSGSHAYDCGSGETCVIEVNDFYFDQIFDAHAWEGWTFVGWKIGRGYLCQRSESVCQLSNRGLGQYEAISAIVESDETFYLEPEFVKGTPFDEALANVQDETLRACLQKVPPPRRYAEQVRIVECYGIGTISSLQGMQAFVRIERLAVRLAPSLEDLKPIGELSRLQYLNLNLASNYFNAAALSELRLLAELQLFFRNAISIQYSSNPDLSEISNLKSLRVLQIYTALGRGHIDISSLAGLSNLEYLTLKKIKNNDFSALAGLTKLEYLDLGSSEITDISTLTGSNNLKTLDLAGNQISDIDPLAGLNNLENLYLAQNEINDISALAGLSKLEYLDLNNNEITDINALAGLSKLEYLDLNNNEITDINALAGLNNLETLDLSGNEVSDIRPLAEMDAIPRLYLQNNSIQDAGPLKQHYPPTLDASFGSGMDFGYHHGFFQGFDYFDDFDGFEGFRGGPNFGVSLDLSNNPIMNLGGALDGIRTGVIFLIDVPLMCKDYPRLVGQYDSRAIVTEGVDAGYLTYYRYRRPERCL